MDKFGEFLGKTVKHTGEKGIVKVTFVVEKDGSITVTNVVSDLSDKSKNEAARAVGLSPNWSIDVYKGKPVRVQYTIPIAFN